MESTAKFHSLPCPSGDDLRIQSAILCYVLGEGHREETIPQLARRFSSEDGEGDAVERAVRELVGAGLLRIERGKVVPGGTSLVGDQVQ
jgi:hypothetical protein